MFVSGIELRFVVHVRRLITKTYKRERRNEINAEATKQEGRNLDVGKNRMSVLWCP